MTTKKTGVKKRDIRVAAAMPPTTAVPIACRLAAPAPAAMTSGMNPAIDEIAVIKIGRNRRRAALMAASTIVSPFARCSRANSTIKIAFLLANPINRTNPIWV